MSEPTKRRHNRTQQRKEPVFFLVAYADQSFSILSAKQVVLDQDDPEMCTVKFGGKKFVATIVKRGNYDDLLKKSKFFASKLSMESADEPESLKKLADLMASDNDSDSGESFVEFVAQKKRKVAECPKGVPVSLVQTPAMPSSALSLSKQASQASTSTASATVDSQVVQTTSGTLIYKAPVPTVERSNLTEQQQAIPSEDFAAMRAQLAELNERVNSQTKKFMHNGEDLVTDCAGRTVVKWSLACSKVLFTEQELMDNVLTKSSKTSRGALDPQRVALLRSAMIYKYRLSHDKEERAWSAIRDAINTRGRNLRYARRFKSIIQHLKLRKSTTDQLEYAIEDDERID